MPQASIAICANIVPGALECSFCRFVPTVYGQLLPKAVHPYHVLAVLLGNGGYHQSLEQF